MKIDNVNINSVISTCQNDPVARTRAEGERQTDKIRAGAGDRVELTTRKDEIEKLKKAAAAMPEVRSDRVAALKERVADGTYKVDAVMVAERMLESFKGSGGTGESR